MSKNIQWAIAYIVLRLGAICGVLFVCKSKLF